MFEIPDDDERPTRYRPRQSNLLANWFAAITAIGLGMTFAFVCSTLILFALLRFYIKESVKEILQKKAEIQLTIVHQRNSISS